MKLFKKKDKIKPGDYIGVIPDEDNEYKCDHTFIYVVQGVLNDTIIYGEGGGMTWECKAERCIKISKEEAEKFFELKGYSDKKKPKFWPCNTKKINVGDIIRPVRDSHHYDMDFVVIAVNGTHVLCTRPNKNDYILVLPMEKCMLVKENK